MLGIRVSTLARFGNGHIARCRSIRHAYHGSVRWYVDEAGGSALPDVDGDELVIDEAPDSAARWSADLAHGDLATGLIDLREMRMVEMTGLARCVALADGMPYPPVPLVIDPQLTAIPGAGRLTGPGYMPLDLAAGTWRGVAAGSGHKATLRLLVAFGTVDSTNRTAPVLKSILAMRHLVDRLAITVVLPLAAPHHAEVKELVGQLPTARLEDQVSNMWPIYAAHDLAVGAPGVSQAERAFCGLPSLLLPQSEQQRQLAQAWHNSGSARAAFDSDGPAAQIEALIDNFAACSAMREAGMALVDGKGATRIAAVLSGMMIGAI